MRRLWNAGTDRVRHRVVMCKSRWLRALRSTHVVLLLPWISARCHGGIANALARLVGRVVEQGTNVVNKQRVQELGDFLLIGEVQRAVERNPAAISTSST